MALALYGLIVAWFDQEGHRHVRFPERPWYRHKVGPTFADMLATMRLHLWRGGWEEAPAEERNALPGWLFHYIATATG